MYHTNEFSPISSISHNAFDYIRGFEPFRAEVRGDLDEPHRNNPAIRCYVKFKGESKWESIII